MPQKVIWVPGSTQKVCQLTGETDRQRKQPTLNRTETNYGLRGTDLGASFEHLGRVCFLFGDTHPSGPNNEWRPFDGDSIAWSRNTSGEGPVRLELVTAPDGKYRAISASGVSLKGFEVPTGGVSAQGQMYVFCTTDSRIAPGKGVVMGRSVLLSSRDEGRTWKQLHTVSRDKFIYIAPVVITNRVLKGIPGDDEKGLLLFAASTEYRRSNLYLAYLPLSQIENPAALRYFAGMDNKGNPQWSERETDSKELFSLLAIGENCVVYDRFLRLWLLLYNCEASRGQRGVHFRTAPFPWGPWSDFGLLFQPDRDNAYGQFMHRADPSKPDDKLSDPGQEKTWGGEYAPLHRGTVHTWQTG